MKRIKKVIFIITGFILLTICFCFIKKSFTHKYNKAVYIYMCGSTLEYKNGSAIQNIKEMLQANISDDTVVVIETGGSKAWSDYNIPSDKIGRYYIKDNKLKKISILPNADMGEEETLTSFLEFCNTKYPADMTTLIFWNHGSTQGFCYDQNYDMNSLDINKLSSALSKTSSHYDMIGFDACLMSEYDTVVTLSDYADYMIASEEIEPVGGWDYISLLEAYNSNNHIEDIGRKICDSYYNKCISHNNEDIAALTLINLNKVPKLIDSFDNFMNYLCDKTNQHYGNFEIVSAIGYTPKLGANGMYEGYSNLIDLKNFSEYFEGNSELSRTLSSAITDVVLYSVSGDNRKSCGGISIYYPVRYTREQHDLYLNNCVSHNYKKYLDILYSDIPEATIVFEDDGSVADDGSFQIKLSQESKKYISSIEFYLLEFNNNEYYTESINKLGADNDIYKNWDDMTFHSNFRGIWLALDGHQLCYTISECNEEQIIFQSPIMVNNKMTNLKFSYTFDNSHEDGGYYEVIGLWEGIDKYGLPSKQINTLKSGDQITILKKSISMSDYNTYYDKSDSFTIGDNYSISEIPLSKKMYQYVYAINDILGNTFYSKSAILSMKYSAEELTDKPLDDGDYAADVLYYDYTNNELIYSNVK